MVVTATPNEVEWRAFLDWYAISGLPVWRRREQARLARARQRAARPEHYHAQDAKRRARNPDKTRAAWRRYSRAYYWRDPERTRTRVAEYARRHPNTMRRKHAKQALVRKLKLKGT